MTHMTMIFDTNVTYVTSVTPMTHAMTRVTLFLRNYTLAYIFFILETEFL
jgi:hypothetical protein